MAYKEKRGANSWRLVVDVGYKADGSRERHTRTVKVEDEALLRTKKKLNDFLEDELYKFKMEIEAGTYVKPQSMTFESFVIKEWLLKYAQDSLSPTTLKTYKEHLRIRILPTIGHMRIDQIKTMHIITFLKDLESPGARKDGRGKYLDIGTIQYNYRVLKNIFKRAKDWEFIAKNPMDGVAKPQVSKQSRIEKSRKEKQNHQYYDEIEAQSVVDALYKEELKWRLLILGSMIGGFRRGELVGLEWPMINFEEGSIKIENNIPLTQNGKAVEKDPKTISSDRSVDMPTWYMDELQVYLEEWEQEKDFLGTKWKGGDRQYVFHNGTGAPYYYQHPSKWWVRFCKRHNLRYIKFHGLRHSMGTLLIEDEDPGNVDSIMKAIQERLGHARKSTTEDIYVHVTKKIKKRTAGKFDKFARSNTEDDHEKPIVLKRIK